LNTGLPYKVALWEKKENLAQCTLKNGNPCKYCSPMRRQPDCRNLNAPWQMDDMLTRRKTNGSFQNRAGDKLNPQDLVLVPI
jgi:hypothetical protein